MDYLSFTHPLNGFLIIGMAVALGVYLTLRFKIGWRLWWIGAFTFLFSQVVHLPFNYLVLNPIIADLIEKIPEAWHLPLIALALGLSSGLCEELARYAMYRWWAKDARTWSQGLLVGAGHGGVEAILIGFFSLYTYLQIEALKDIDLITIFPAEQVTLVQQQLAHYWSMPWYESLLGAVERAFAIPLHLAASVLVLQIFTRQQFRWIWPAIGLHTLVNALAVYLANASNVYIAELAIGILAAFDIAIILILRRWTPIRPNEPDIIHLPPRQVTPIPEVPETSEKLEQTRYQ